MLELYKNIRIRRQELHMTQEELALKSGYTNRSSIATIEAGKMDLPLPKIIAIANALETTPSKLMGSTEDFDASMITTAASIFKEDDPLLLRLVKAYNQLPYAQKTALVQLAESMAQK